MANVFSNLPVTVGDGTGLAVDTSTMGRERTITVQDAFNGTVIIEFSNEGAAGPWAQLTTFTQTGKQTLEVAARFMRVRRTGVPTIAPGLPNVDIASNDDGGLFFDLPATIGNGIGAAIDVSTIGTFNTVTVLGTFRGTVVVEISEDGIDFATCMTFNQPGFHSKVFVAQFMRIVRKNVPGVSPGFPNIDVGAINDATPGGGAGSGSACLIYREGAADAGPTVFGTWADLITQLAVLRAANNSDGCYEIQFDDAVTSPITIPPGTYDMNNVSWSVYPGRNTSTFLDVLAPEGSVFTNLRKLDAEGPSPQARFESTATVTSPISDISDGDVFIIHGWELQASGGVPLIDASGLGIGHFATFFFDQGGTGFGGVGPAIDIPTVGSIGIFRFRGTAGLQPDTISSVAGSTVIFQVNDDSNFSFSPQDHLGTSIFQITPRQRWGINPAPPAGPYVAPTSPPSITYNRFDVSGGAVVQPIALANAGIFPGQVVIFKETSGSSGLTIVPGGADTIDGAVTPISVPAGGTVAFIADGFTDWEILWRSSTIKWSVIGPVVADPAPVALGTLVQADPSGGAFAVTLPAIAAANEGEEIIIKNTTSSVLAITVTPTGADTIDGAATFVITTAFAAITLVSDGIGNWNIV